MGEVRIPKNLITHHLGGSMNQTKKKFPLLLASLILFLLVTICVVGAIYNYLQIKQHDEKINIALEHNTTLKDELIKLKNENNKNNIRMDQMNNAMNQNKETGNRVVTASMLNIRQDPSADSEPIGQLFMNVPVQVIDTANPLWFKIQLNVDSFVRKDDKELVLFTDKAGNELMQISKKFLNGDQLKNGSEYFVHSNYLAETKIKISNELPNSPKKPFIYGLLFFDKKIAEKLQSDIWTDLGAQLRKLGYDGVKVIPVIRKSFVDDVKANKYDAVESAPGDFLSANKEGTQLNAFAKTVNKVNNSSTYSGLIIANKKSGIKSFQDLKGKKIYTANTFSESGYKYQKFYLDKFQKLDISKEKNITSDFQHQEVFLKVATGEADAGFVGDFVMFTDPLYRIKTFADKLGLQLLNEQQLENLKKNVVILSMDELSEIPNNPHSVKAALFDNKDLVNQLKSTVTNSYNNYREDFGLTDAISSEYDFLAEFE